MSIGSLGPVSSLAATPLAQKSPEAEKTLREAAEHARQTQSAASAESAAGIGQTEEDSEASDRDADGRSLLERRWPRCQPVQDPAGSDATASRGDSGTLLDISG